MAASRASPVVGGADPGDFKLLEDTLHGVSVSWAACASSLARAPLWAASASSTRRRTRGIESSPTLRARARAPVIPRPSARAPRVRCISSPTTRGVSSTTAAERISRRPTLLAQRRRARSRLTERCCRGLLEAPPGPRSRQRAFGLREPARRRCRPRRRAAARSAPLPLEQSARAGAGSPGSRPGALRRAIVVPARPRERRTGR